MKEATTETLEAMQHTTATATATEAVEVKAVAMQHTATSATSETTGKGGDHGGRGGTKKAEAHHHRDTTEAMTTEAMTEAQSDHVCMYVARSDCICMVRGKNSLNARKTWTELGETPWMFPCEFPQKTGEAIGKNTHWRILQKMQPIGTAAGARCTGQSCALMQHD